MAYAKYGEWASDHVNMLLEACNTVSLCVVMLFSSISLRGLLILDQFIRLLLDQTHDQTVIDDLERRATVCSALSVQLLVKLARLQGDKTAQVHIVIPKREHTF